jgi:hypothetical protein
MKHILFVLIGLTVLVSGCKKDSGWAGVYSGNTSGNTVQRVIVSDVNATTLKMELQVLNSGVYYTFATIAGAKVVSDNAAEIAEDGVIALTAGTFRFAGNAQKSSSTLTIAGTATNKSNSSDVKYYYFTGSK